MSAGKPPDHAGPRLRRLSEDEIELWVAVAAGVIPRPDSHLPQRLPRPASPPALPATSSAASAALPPPTDPKPRLPPLAPLDRKLRQRLSRGRASVDDVLDLHGLRQEEALATLRRFLHRARVDDCKVVLVVTGKGGRPSADSVAAGFGETGVLRRLVPIWLGMPDIRPVVLGFEEANRSHGGSGALYVRLRRRKP